MAKCWVEWNKDADNNDYWICRKYMMGFKVKHPAHADRCYIATCPGRTSKPEIHLPEPRPLIIKIEEPRVVEEPRVCAAHNCDKPVAAHKQNHCSEACRRRANRYAYKQRQKTKKVDIFPKTPAE